MVTGTEARRALIAGNWKMNLDHLQSIALVQKLAWTLKDRNFQSDSVEVAIFPPFTDLRSVQTLIAADKLDFSLGGQDLSAHDAGAYTGEISGAFLAALACDYALVGHSERRAQHGEDDQVCLAKVQAALRHAVTPVLCVGETAEDLETVGQSAVPVSQLRAVLEEVPPEADIVVAYEPVWAIGSGTPATAKQAEEVCAVLRDTIREIHGDAQAQRTRILYGGSVKSGNIAGLMRGANVDGALVGGASLDAEEFAAIAQFEKHVTIH
ncbi:MAG: triose-phosphate isomerase [Pontimonas sp.]